jgi:hypothetical protein
LSAATPSGSAILTTLTDPSAQGRPRRIEAGGTVATDQRDIANHRWQQAFRLRPLDTAAEDQTGGEEEQGSQAHSPAADSSAGLASSPSNVYNPERLISAFVYDSSIAMNYMQ